MTVAAALAEVAAALEATDPAAIAAACDLIAGSGSIMGHGCGRERLMIAGLVMRLHHLGLRATMQGDMAAPPLGPGDLLLASAGPGELSTVTSLMQVARAAGADVLFLTAEPATPAAGLATRVLHIPAMTMARDRGAETVLPMGSVYEGALFFLAEIMVLRLRTALGQSAAMMRARHTNME
jgi:6-phospho-3-hexuloisomerase